jgi:hypothetical protein
MFQDHKKHVAARVKQLIPHGKSPMQSDPALASNINQSLETPSGEEDSNMCIWEESLRDACSVYSNLEKEVGENYVQKDDEQITIRYLAHPNTEQTATTHSTHLNTDQEIVMNDMHKNLEQIKITSNGHETELHDLQKNVDKVTEISTSSHSDLKQEMAAQRNVGQFQTVNSKSDAVSSQISDSIPCDTESAVVGPQDLRLTEHDPVILETAPCSSPEKSDTVSSQFDTYHTEFPMSDSASTDLVVTKSNVPNVTKLEMGELQNKTETRK